ncbi:MAG TPA: CHAP domain-containing protein [Bryobacteraceae bacterium]|nr:CHAP domain-containing protein [Bryobacteraceae bacterium]
MFKLICGSVLALLVSGCLDGQQLGCGAIVDSYSSKMNPAVSVSAYSNGIYTGVEPPASCQTDPPPLGFGYPVLLPGQQSAGQDGDQYQCVEFIRRFYREAKKDIAASDWYGTFGDAQDFYLHPAYFGLVRYPNGGTIPPQLDDIVGFASANNKAGHVAIVKEIDDIGGAQFTIKLIEQNTNQPHQLTVQRQQQSNGTLTYVTYSISPRCKTCFRIQGWMRSANQPPPPPSVTIKEYALLAYSQPHDITAGPDGALWFAETGATRGIGHITTNGVLNSYPNSGANGGITVGPDGALWFTEWFGGFSNDRIGRLSTMGALIEYPVPSLNAFPLTITVGPDGALWFTEYTANKIGRITTNGAVTEYPIPTVPSHPSGITAGPDGALWFTEIATTKVGRITTSGVITEYALPSYPFGIVTGPDGALWFTEFTANKIGRVTTAGTVTEYPIPTTNSQPLEITVGPDGALWFTEEDGNNIGRITTTGTVTEYPVPTLGSQPYGISLGPDGALWFTEQSGNNVSQVTLN